MRGRASECAMLDALIEDVRRGESRALVVRGEAGIGKTALLDYLVESASGMTVARAGGVESEMELAYASLHQICGPLLDRLPALPTPQRDALEIVFGVRAGPPPFAERARTELQATGEHVRLHAVKRRDDLTAQERQIAKLARDGLSNPEIGARLFLSPRTVEWHLRHVFTKLGIKSRRELASALPRSETEAAVA